MKSNNKKQVYRASFQDDGPRYTERPSAPARPENTYGNTPWGADSDSPFHPAQPPQDDYDYLYPDDPTPPETPIEPLREIPPQVPLSDEPSIRPERPKRKKKSKKKHGGWGVVALLSALMLIALSVFIVSAYNSYAPFRRRVSATQSSVIADGVFIDDIGVGGMTKTQALSILTYGEKAPDQTVRIGIQIDGQIYVMTENDVPFTRSVQAVVDQAYGIGRQSSVQTLGSSVTPFKWRSDYLDYVREHGAYLYTEMAYDKSDVERFVSQVLSMVQTEPRDAMIASFDFNSRSFTFTDEVYGRLADRDKIVNAVTQALDKRQYQTVLCFETKPVTPNVTKTMLLNSFSLIAKVDSATTADPSRNANILLATRSVNGRVLYPDETFSFNAALGARTVAKGYIAALEDPADASTEIGGGASQVSSALFDAVMTAGLTVVSRTPFPYVPSAISPGLDAYVDSNTDFKFRNSTDYPVFIVAGYSQGRSMTLPGTVKIEIYGVSQSAGTEAALDVKLVSETDAPAPQYRKNETLSAGTQRTVLQGNGACRYETYRVLKQNGREIMRELQCISSYPEKTGIIEYN